MARGLEWWLASKFNGRKGVGVVYDVFISYSTKDAAVADAVCAALEGRGIHCWIAPRDVEAGKSYAESISGGVKQTKALVLILSANSNASHAVEREVEMAFRTHKSIIPFRIEDVQLSNALDFFVSSIHWIDAFPPPRNRQIEKLAVTICHRLGTPVEFPPPAKDSTHADVSIPEKMSDDHVYSTNAEPSGSRVYASRFVLMCVGFVLVCIASFFLTAKKAAEELPKTSPNADAIGDSNARKSDSQDHDSKPPVFVNDRKDNSSTGKELSPSTKTTSSKSDKPFKLDFTDKNIQDIHRNIVPASPEPSTLDSSNKNIDDLLHHKIIPTTPKGALKFHYEAAVKKANDDVQKLAQLKASYRIVLQIYALAKPDQRISTEQDDNLCITQLTVRLKNKPDEIINTFKLAYRPSEETIEVACFNKSGEPVLNSEGWHKQIAHYNGSGQTRDISLFGLSGEPVSCQDRYHRQIFSYSADMELTNETFLNTRGDMMKFHPYSPPKKLSDDPFEENGTDSQKSTAEPSTNFTEGRSGAPAFKDDPYLPH